MNYSKYIAFDELLHIGDYKRLHDELKDINGTFSYPKQPNEEQIINLFYLYMSKLELGKYSEVEKFLNSKSFQKYLLYNELPKLFLVLLQLSYLYEKENYSDFQPLTEQFTLLESKYKNEPFIIEKIALIFLLESYLSYKKAVFVLYDQYFAKSTDYQQKLDNNYYSTLYFNISSQINNLKGNTTQALSNIQQSYDYSIFTKNIKLQAYAMLHLASFNYRRGQIQNALDNCENSFMIGKKLGNIKLMGESLLMNARISHYTADLEQANSFTSKALDYFSNINYKYGILEIHNLIGNINQIKGDLDEALKYFALSLKESRENQDPFAEAMILNNIGNIYSDKGLFDKAIDNYNLSLELSSTLNYKSVTSVVLISLGYNYHLKADYERSIEFYEKSLEQPEGNNNIVHLADIYFNLIILNIEVKNDNQINHYFDQLRELTSKSDNKLVFYYYELSRALIQKSKNRMNYFAEAQEILKRLISEDTPHAGLRQIAIINLADLMIKELAINQNPELLSELNSLIDKLYTHGKEKNLFHIIIEALILKSKITLIEGNLKQAERLLVQASIMAEEKNLTYLVIKSNAEYKEFRKQITHWAELVEGNTLLIEKIKLTEIQNYIDDLQKIAFK